MVSMKDLNAKWTLILSTLKLATVEPFLFLFMFGYTIRAVSLQNLLIERSCYIELGISKAICQDLDNKTFENEQAKSLAFGNNLMTAGTICVTVPSLILSTFLGQWSDVYGRRYCLILSTAGVLIDSLISLFFTAFEETSPYLILFSEFFSGLGGGIIVTISSVYSYLSDITDEKARPTRYAVLEFCFILSAPLGTLTGGQTYQASGYMAVMILGASVFSCALLWAIFMIKENKNLEGIPKSKIIRDLFRIDNVVQSYKTCTVKRPGNLRLQIWLLIFVSVATRIATIGIMSLGFTYVKYMFKWGVTEYANATTVLYVFHAIAIVTVVPALNRVFLLHEAAVGLIGAISLIAKYVVFTVAVKPALVYYAWACGLLSSCAGIATRSRMSKLVSRSELGRIFSLLATCEALTPVIAISMMTQIYNASYRFFPGLAFAISGLLAVPIAIIFGWMMRLPTVSFAELENEPITEEMDEMKEVSQFKK